MWCPKADTYTMGTQGMYVNINIVHMFVCLCVWVCECNRKKCGHVYHVIYFHLHTIVGASVHKVLFLQIRMKSNEAVSLVATS